MKIATNLLLFVSVSIFFSLSTTSKVPIPLRIKACMESSILKAYSIDSRVNPFYLRGDFDGDGKPDFAVMIIRAKGESSGLAICQGDGRNFILGAGTNPKLSTKKEDSFLSSDWEVLTLAEFRKFVEDPRRGALAKGEVIALNWEDGNGYVYWDGERYRWLRNPRANQISKARFWSGRGNSGTNSGDSKYGIEASEPRLSVSDEPEEAMEGESSA